MELQSRAGAESAHALGCRRLRIPRAKYPRFEHDVCVQYIVEALLLRPVSVAVAVSTPPEGGVPEKPGLYAWWAGGNALPELVGTSHPHVAGLELLYVGICPDRVAGMRTIRDRLPRDHMRRTHRDPSPGTGCVPICTRRVDARLDAWRSPHAGSRVRNETDCLDVRKPAG
jgi:hypothetical protein